MWWTRTGRTSSGERTASRTAGVIIARWSSPFAMHHRRADVACVLCRWTSHIKGHKLDGVWDTRNEEDARAKCARGHRPAPSVATPPLLLAHQRTRGTACSRPHLPGATALPTTRRLARDLLDKILQRDPAARPSMADVLKHPFMAEQGKGR